MNQLNIFHVIGLNTDPVYNSICTIPNNSEIQIDHNVIRKTEKYFEVENDDEHLLFRTIEECYQFVSGIIIHPSKKLTVAPVSLDLELPFDSVINIISEGC